MRKTITLDGPELRAGLNAVNAYIAQELGYSYKPKREMSPQEKGKRALKWKFWQTQLAWMNKYLDYVINITPAEGVSVGGYCLFNLTLTDKSTGNVEEQKDLHFTQARYKLREYQQLALKAKYLNSNQSN